MKKFLVALLVAMLALSCVALADVLDDAVNHKTHANYVAPTCQETGFCRDYDTVNGTYVDYTLKMIAHGKDKGVVTVEPTCTEPGVITYTCQNVIDENGTKCGHVWTDKIVQTQHPEDFFWIVKPDCQTIGIGAIGCANCGEYNEGSKVTWWAGATDGAVKYTEDGEKLTAREICKKKIGSTDVKDHTDLSGWLIISEDDCYNPLLKENLCRACNTTLRVYEEKKGHELKDAKVVMINNPNCKTVAVYANVEECKYCDYFEINTALNSDGYVSYGNLGSYGSSTDEAKTAISDAFNANFEFPAGSKVNVKNTGKYYIKSHFFLSVKLVDGTALDEEAWARGHHVIDEASAKSENVYAGSLTSLKCYHEGNDVKGHANYMMFGKKVTTYKCLVCKDTIADFTEEEPLTPPAHKFTAWKEVVTPTEDTNFIGKWTRYCLNNGCTEFESYIGGVCGKDNHLEDAPVLENVVEATYTAEGSAEEVIYCAVCGEELSRTEIVLPMLEGVNPEDGLLYEDGKASTATGIVSFGGKDYYLINGKKQESMGATLVDGTWYFMAHGIVQEVTQLCEYQGEWFVVKGGKIDISYNGLVEYDGAKFLVGAGRIQTEQTTLYNDGTNWYLISAGKVATEYTGAFTYDGQVFDVVAGIVK